MTSAPIDTPNTPDQDAPYFRDFLHGMLEVGADLLRMIHKQAKAQSEATPTPQNPTPGPSHKIIIGYDRITRGMRRAILIARHLDAPRPQRQPTAAEHRKAARQRIIRTVEDAIQRDADEYEAAALNAELDERLDSPDLEDDIAGRPIADIIAEICRDFGLAHVPGNHPWKRRTPADIADLNARAAAPCTQPRPVSSAHPNPANRAPPPKPIWAPHDPPERAPATISWRPG